MSLLPALLALSAVHLLAVVTPGPAFVAAIQISVRQSRRNALLHGLGLGLAAVAWATAVVFGLEAVMVRIAWLYRLLQFAGGVYLVYIGIQSWCHSKEPIRLEGSASDATTGFDAFRLGFATNIANPKVMVFFASIFTALLDPRWPLWVRLVALAIVAVDETGWYTLLSLLLSTRHAQSVWKRAKTGLERTAGSVMILFGERLIWGARN